MAGSSPGTSGRPPCLSGEMSGAREACPSPCNRGCAPLECTVKFTKFLKIRLISESVKKRDYVNVTCYGDGENNYYKLSIDNFVRTISSCAEVEGVCINFCLFNFEDNEILKAFCKSMKTISSLKSLEIGWIRSSELSVSDAEAIFSVLGVNRTLQECTIQFARGKPTEAAIVKVLVDVVLQNQALHQFNLEFVGRSRLASKGVVHESGVLRELSRYMRAPTSAQIMELIACELSNDEAVQLADMLGDNRQLQRLRLEGCSHGKGMGKMGEALRTNTALEVLLILDTLLGGEEMKALVGALIPDATSGFQPNTCLHTLVLHGTSIEGKEGMEQLATLLRSNTSLLYFSLHRLNTLDERDENVAEYAEMLFASLRSNASLESLSLYYCTGIGGKHMLGMIMDMLLHNHTLREIELWDTGLEKDGDAEVVYAELRTRGKVDRKLEQAIRRMVHVPPNSARVFLCGDPEAGKTTLCDRWIELYDEEVKQSLVKKGRGFFRKFFLYDTIRKSKKAPGSQKHVNQSEDSERTRGIEVHKLTWKGMEISVWDMAGQQQYHAFHDLVLPNQSTKGEGCFYFVVCDPTKYWNRGEKKPSSELEATIGYWLMFLASNTRRSASYRPHVSILMTHRDLWKSNNVMAITLKKVVTKLKKKFHDVLDFDQDMDFINMDNKKSCDDAAMVKGRVEEYLQQLCLKLPRTLKASVELQSIVAKWRKDHVHDHILKWEDFSRNLFEEVEELKPWKNGDEEILEKVKKRIARCLHSGGHIMYFEDIALVIMNPHWFCNHAIGNILHDCSELNKACDNKENGIISKEDFIDLCKEEQSLGLYKDHYEDIFDIMKKLQICYEDGDDKIMIPSILTNKQDTMDWRLAFDTCAQEFNYVGTRLTSKDETITLLTEGFYPRLQVYLREKFDLNSYKIYLNVVSFIYNDINVFITRKDGSINIMSRSSGDGDHANHALHKTIINHLNDLRQKPTLGCPGVIFEEHSIWPRCVEHPFLGKLQSVSKKHLRETVLRTGDLTYGCDWIDDKGCAGFSYASKLLGDEEWHKILESRDRMVKEMDEDLNQRLVLASSEEIQSLNTRDGDVEAVCSDSGTQQVLAKLDSMKRLMQCNHKELMERLIVMESKIIRSQKALAARVCSNIDRLMECSVQLKNSKIPKLPYIMKSDGTRAKHILLKMVADLTTCRLHFRCEHNDHGFHHVDDQPGCEIRIGTDRTRKVGTVMFWGLVISTTLLKVGAHLVAGMGSMVPDLTREFATILDSPGLLDLAQPKGRILECLPAEFKDNPVISVQDNEEAKDWLVKVLERERESRSMYEMFKLTEVVYTSKSSKKQETGWVCDAHRN